MNQEKIKHLKSIIDQIKPIIDSRIVNNYLIVYMDKNMHFYTIDPHDGVFTIDNVFKGGIEEFEYFYREMYQYI